jgi:hypothetical protein
MILLPAKAANCLFVLPAYRPAIVTGLIHNWLHYLNKNYTASQSYYQKAVNVKPGAIETKSGYVKSLSFLQQW